jgi:hypothetical protein
MTMCLKDRYGEPERGEWMGADKNFSRRRWKLLQDEHGFQHTSPTHYPSWPSPRSHWSATGPRNKHTTFRLENAAEHQTSGLQTHAVRRWAPPVRPALAGETKQLSLSGSTPVRPVRHTGQTDRSMKAPKAPNRPTDHQTDPNSKQQHHRTTTNTPRRSPEQNPTKGCTGQTGQEHRSDRCSLGSSGWTAPAGQLPQIQTSISRIAPRIWTRLWGY